MSYSKGDKLWSKGRNWKERGYPYWIEPIEKAAKWYEENGQFINAGGCWYTIGQFGKAFSCYKNVSKESAINSLNALIGKCDKERKYKEAMECCILKLIYSRAGPSLFKIIATGIKKLPKETIQDSVKQNWTEIEPLIKLSDMDGLYDSVEIITIFDGDDFIEKYVLSIAAGLDTTRLYFCEYLRQRCKLPNLAVKICEMALKDQLRAKKDLKTWTDSEWFWLRELSMAYVDAGDSRKALDIFLSRHWYSEAAGIMEILGRFEEAKEMLKRLGPENYHDLDGNWMNTKQDEINALFEKKIRQLEGKVAANQYLSGTKAENVLKIDVQELKKMFALGEISQEEYERKSKTANPTL